MIPVASEMAQTLEAGCQALLEVKVIENECWSNICSVVSQLKSIKDDSGGWRYTVTASSPLTFRPVENFQLDQYITPRIYATVEVKNDLCEKKIPPFVDLNCVIQVLGEDGNPLLHTHMDMAEKNQGGQYQHAPLFHLQVGGHHPGADRSRELRLKEPRLPFPPVDLLLACEIVVSNFYPDEWKCLHSHQSWILSICQSQRLCFPAYVEKLQSCLSASRYTASHQLWAGVWGA